MDAHPSGSINDGCVGDHSVVIFCYSTKERKRTYIRVCGGGAVAIDIVVVLCLAAPAAAAAKQRGQKQRELSLCFLSAV